MIWANKIKKKQVMRVPRKNLLGVFAAMPDLSVAVKDLIIR
jgi:hypothetical protein